MPALFGLSMIAAHDPVRVLLVISNLEYGGAQRQVVELNNHIDPARFDVRICSLSDYVPLGRELRDPSRLIVIRKRFKFDASVVPRLAALLRRSGVDIAHSYLFDADIAVRLATHLAGTPLCVGSERNTDYHLKARQLVAYRLTRAWVDLIVANSRAGAEFNRRTLGHDPSIYRVVRNGVDVERFTPGDGIDVRRELGIVAGEHLVGMFASFKPQKNHALFFAAARKLLERCPRARFLMVGEELHGGLQGTVEHRQRMERLAEDMGLKKRCLFLGNRRDVERLYRACELTVLPSSFEGTPNVLIESMACGIPVVATDVSDNSYIVREDEVGYLVPLGDAASLADRIARLLENRALRDRLGRQARSWVVREFSSARMARNMETVYLEALGRPTAAGEALPRAATVLGA